MKSAGKGILEFNGQEIPYEIIRSSRRTMAAQVTRDGTVVIRTPEGVADQTAAAFAGRYAAWILEHYKAAENRLNESRSFRWGDGADLWLHGINMKLQVNIEPEYKRAAVRAEDGFLRLFSNTSEEAAVKAAVKAWYRKEAARVISDRACFWAGVMKITYARISIREQSTRWGSCSIRGNLNFNWKLVMMPPEILDYVVVHELAHREEMNHSPDFWKIVQKYIPDYQLKRRRLKEYESKVISEY